MRFLDFLTETIGVDPGTQSLRIIKEGKLIFNERSQISFDKIDNVFSGLGNSIRTTPKDTIIKPVNYSIWDFHGFETLLRGAIKKGLNSNSVIPKSYIMHYCIPTGTSEVEKRAYRDSGEHANAKEVYMIHQSCCAAIGLNILFEIKNFILIDFSSSKIEIAIFANSLLISVGSLRLGTWKIFSIVKNYIHRTYKIDLRASLKTLIILSD
jgi:rod shape-determining protein MreB and related proteins